jgi:hypothetical protein
MVKLDEKVPQRVAPVSPTQKGIPVGHVRDKIPDPHRPSTAALVSVALAICYLASLNVIDQIRWVASICSFRGCIVYLLGFRKSSDNTTAVARL